MPCIEKEPIYDMYCTRRRHYQRFLNILFGDVSVAQLVASMSGVVLGGVVEVVGSNLARGNIVLKKSNRMHKFLFYMANRFHVKKQFSKPLNVAFLC